MSRREERAIREEAEQLAAEAEAMLSGRLAERSGNERAPGWVWLNTLAHSDWNDLADVVDARRAQRTAWDGAVMFLAGEILSAAGSPDGLLELQRNQLVPLELELLSGAMTPPSTPAGLVSIVRSELARVRSRHAHPSTDG